MTPFSSVAMLQKLALLKIAFCRAPAFQQGLFAADLGDDLDGWRITLKKKRFFHDCFRVALFAQNALKTRRYFGQDDRFGKKRGSPRSLHLRPLYFSFHYGRRQEYDPGTSFNFGLA